MMFICVVLAFGVGFIVGYSFGKASDDWPNNSGTSVLVTD